MTRDKIAKIYWGRGEKDNTKKPLLIYVSMILHIDFKITVNNLFKNMSLMEKLVT